MTHLPKVPGKPEAMCGGSFPSTSVDINETTCRKCLWSLVAMLMGQVNPALHRLLMLEAQANGRKANG